MRGEYSSRMLNSIETGVQGRVLQDIIFKQGRSMLGSVLTFDDFQSNAFPTI